MRNHNNNGSGPRTPSSSLKDFKLFPSLLVVPEHDRPRSNRRCSRVRGREDTWKHTYVVWALFTFLDGGCPYTQSDQVSLANRALANPWTSRHAESAGLLHNEIHRFTRLRSHEPLGRGLEQVNKLVTLIQNSGYSDYKPGSCDISELSSTAMNVDPNRMSLPEVAGIIDPIDHLKGPELQAFKQMAQEVPHGIEPDKPTKGCFKIAPDKISKVYRQLLDSEVATLIPSKLALKDSKGNIIAAGLFAVPHKESSDRVICDRRPMNELERRLVWAKLPHGSLLTQIILPKDSSLRGSGDDLSNYFYLLKSWLHRNAVGSPVSGKDFLDYGCDPDESYMLAFRVIPMGDLNAVDIAQQTHLEILRDAGCMKPEETLAFRSPVPHHPCLEGLYIDDHIVIQMVKKRKFRGHDKNKEFRDDEILQASRENYKKLNIPVSSKKAFTKEYQFQAWGTSVDSRTGRVGTPIQKLHQLGDLLAKVCALPRVSKKLLQKTLGLIVHPAMHQRCIMCLLQESYLWVEKLQPGQPRKLPNAVKEELLMVALILPLCHSNVRWQIATRIGASDASLSGGGRAATLTTPSIAKTLYHYSVHKGEPVRLDWERGAIEPPSGMTKAPAELEELMNAHTWNTTHRCSFGHKQHINILELKMVRAELIDLVKQSSSPCRAILLVDSRVVAGAWGKGRSSSKQINRILRSMLGWSLIGQKSLHLVWVQSSKNPADHPSRGAPIPEPPENPPILDELFCDRKPVIPKRLATRKIQQASERAVREEDVEAPPHSDSLRLISKTDKTIGQACRIPHPALPKWTFREIFAGEGALTQEFREHSDVKVAPPVELIQRGRPSRKHDLLCDETFGYLIKEAKRPRQLWHFGLPCSSFSLMQNMNGGTRSKRNPEGDDTLDRENKGNELAWRTIYLCKILHEHGSFFTIENPLTSYAWHLKAMLNLISVTKAKFVRFDQCCYNLKIPDSHGALGLAKKATLILGSVPGLEKLGRCCDGSHAHVQVIGGANIKKGWQRRSTLAGRYPNKQLCSAYRKCFEHCFD